MKFSLNRGQLARSQITIAKEWNINPDRVGIIGLGNRGSTIIKVLNQLPAIRIVACCDILDFRLNEGLDKIAEKAIISFNMFFNQIENEDDVVSFVKRQLNSSRNSTRVKAEKFLEKIES